MMETEGEGLLGAALTGAKRRTELAKAETRAAPPDPVLTELFRDFVDRAAGLRRVPLMEMRPGRYAQRSHTRGLLRRRATSTAEWVPASFTPITYGWELGLRRHVDVGGQGEYEPISMHLVVTVDAEAAFAVRLPRVDDLVVSAPSGIGMALPDGMYLGPIRGSTMTRGITNGLRLAHAYRAGDGVITIHDWACSCHVHLDSPAILPGDVLAEHLAQRMETLLGSC